MSSSLFRPVVESTVDLFTHPGHFESGWHMLRRTPRLRQQPVQPVRNRQRFSLTHMSAVSHFWAISNHQQFSPEQNSARAIGLLCRSHLPVLLQKLLGNFHAQMQASKRPLWRHVCEQSSVASYLRSNPGADGYTHVPYCLSLRKLPPSPKNKCTARVTRVSDPQSRP